MAQWAIAVGLAVDKLLNHVGDLGTPRCDKTGTEDEAPGHRTMMLPRSVDSNGPQHKLARFGASHDSDLSPGYDPYSDG